jgi:hypothetical protein
LPRYVHTGGPAITPTDAGPVCEGDPPVTLGAELAAEYVAAGILLALPDLPAEAAPKSTPPADGVKESK